MLQGGVLIHPAIFFDRTVPPTPMVNFHPLGKPRRLVLVLGDQLDANSAAFDGFDPQRDAVWMAEVVEESTHVWSHQARSALF